MVAALTIRKYRHGLPIASGGMLFGLLALLLLAAAHAFLQRDSLLEDKETQVNPMTCEAAVTIMPSYLLA